MNIDIFTLLELDRNTSPKIVKKKYQKMMMLYHPDKPTGDTLKYRLLNKCYNEYVKSLPQESDHNAMRKRNDNYQRSQEGVRTQRPAMATDKNFNVDRFNQIFEENRFEDENTSRGYANLDEQLGQDYIESHDTKNLLPHKTTKSNFNESFRTARQRQRQIREQRARDDPNHPYNKQLANAYEPVSLTATSMGFSEIGSGSISDFTNDDPYARGTKYTDYRRAFYEDNTLIDPESVQVRQYTNIQEYEMERGRSTKMTPEEIQRQHEYEEYKKRQEQERLDNLHRQNKRYDDYERKINTMFLEN